MICELTQPSNRWEAGFQFIDRNGWIDVSTDGTVGSEQ